MDIYKYIEKRPTMKIESRHDINVAVTEGHCGLS